MTLTVRKVVCKDINCKSLIFIIVVVVTAVVVVHEDKARELHKPAKLLGQRELCEFSELWILLL